MGGYTLILGFALPLSNRWPTSPVARAALGSSLLVGAVVATSWAVHSLRDWAKRQEKNRIRERKQKWCLQTIADVCQAVSEDPQAVQDKDVLTKMPALELVRRIKAGELSSLRVLRAFQAKALDAHERTNCICWFFPEAEGWARACDANPKKEGCLFGLPVSIKDHWSVKDHDSTYGVVCHLEKPYERDALITELVRDEGAVLFVRTNAPQLMLSCESGNPVFGLTRNPHDPSRISGGSSGGEGAIIGYGASPLGFGSDIGGSIRIPAGLCGICGFKPTVERMSKRWMPRVGEYGQNIIDETFGPMSPDMDSIIAVMRMFWAQKMFDVDRKIPPLVFNEQMLSDTRPLRIGYYVSNGTVDPVPAVERAMDHVISGLKSRGHTLVRWQPKKLQEMMLSEFSVLSAHGGVLWAEDLEHDIIDPCIYKLIKAQLKPYWYKKLLVWLAKKLNPDEAKFMETGLGIWSAMHWWDKVEEICDLRDMVDDEWRHLGLDVVVAPVWPTPAMPCRWTGDMTTEELSLHCVIYTAITNVLDLPSGTVPVTKVTEDDVAAMANYPRDDPISKAIQACMEGSVDLPVNLQVIGPRFKDECALRIMKEIESLCAT